jgi:hypothetical protein
VPTDQTAVIDFLLEFKARASTGRDLYLIDRKVNLETLSDLGLTWNTFRMELLSLSIEDYVAGPEPDEDKTKKGDVWMFGKEKNCEVYIKLKNFDVGPDKRTKCISIHKAKYPIEYPLRK